MELLYGRHSVLEAVRAGRRRIHRIYVGRGAKKGNSIPEITSLAQGHGIAVGEMPGHILGQLGAVSHQGVAAEVGDYPYVDLADLLEASEGQPCPLFLVLDHLQDVQNLGTLLRTAEAMAVSGVLLPERRSAGITPAVVNASAGAVEHLPVALVVNLVQAIGTLKQRGLWIAGLDMGPDSIGLAKANLKGPLAVVVGAEGSGLARLVRESCDWLLGIPMLGKVSSLNAAVAGSIALVMARQQQTVEDQRAPI